MPAYNTTLALRAYDPELTDTAGRNSETELAAALDEASDYLDLMLNRTFGPRYITIRASNAPLVTVNRSASNQLYYGDGTPYLRVEPCFGPIAVKLGSSAGADIAVTSWRPMHSRDAQSAIVLVRLDGIWAENAAYNVNAELGMAATPVTIQRAVLELAQIRRLQSRRAQGAATFGEDGLDTNATARDIVERYYDEWRIPREYTPRGRL